MADQTITPWQANYERQLPDRLRSTADSGDDGCLFCKQSLHEAAAALERAYAARDAGATRIDGMNRAINGLIGQLDAALRERDEARAALTSNPLGDRP